jgi:hypothetical protein
MTENVFKKRIMRRVYLLYAIRKIRGPILSKFILFSLFLLALSSLVSIPSIISNMPLSAGALYDFLVAAFLNTHFTVQAILTLMMIAGILLIREIVAKISMNTYSFK